MIKDFDLLQRANNDYTTIDLEHAEELAYRELIDSIRYIPLGDECGVMGNIANIILLIKDVFIFRKSSSIGFLFMTILVDV